MEATNLAKGPPDDGTPKVHSSMELFRVIMRRAASFMGDDGHLMLIEFEHSALPAVLKKYPDFAHPKYSASQFAWAQAALEQISFPRLILLLAKVGKNAKEGDLREILEHPSTN